MNDSTTTGSSTAADSSTISRPADTMRERVGETRVRIWFLIGANRWLVTGLFSLLAYVLLLLFHMFGPTSVRKLVTTSLDLARSFDSPDHDVI